MLGCVLANELKASASLLFAVVPLVVCVVYCIKKHKLALMLPMLVCFMLFAGYYEIRDIKPNDIAEGKSHVIGTICEDPYIQTEKGRQIIVLDSCKIDGKKVGYKIRVNLYSTSSKYEYGQIIDISAMTLRVPDGATNPNGFDYKQYLWRDGIALYGSAQEKKTEITKDSASFATRLYRFADKLAGICDDIFGDSSDIMRAVLLGDKSKIDDETRDSFSKSGISHILAVSGLHVSAIALMLSFIFKKLRLPLIVNYILTVLLLTVYAIMTGASVSTGRAVLMFALLCATQLLGYPTDTLTRMALAMLIQLTFNPLVITDSSFILSYGCVGAILLGSDMLEISNKVRSIFSRMLSTLVSSAMASFVVQVITFPILACLFYTVPLLSVPVNVICVPLAMLALYAGVVLLLIGAFSVSAACFLAYPVRLIWQVIRWVSTFVGQLGISTITTRTWPLWLAAVYLLFALFSSRYFSVSRIKRGVCTLILIAFAIAYTTVPANKQSNCTILFLDVGNADCAVINVEGDSYLIDCGYADSTAAEYLAGSGAQLKGIFLSHADTDHCGGLAEVRDYYPEATVYLPSSWQNMEIQSNTEAALVGADIQVLASGDRIELKENAWLDVLWPTDGFEFNDDNNASMVLKFTYETTVTLFMADVTDDYDVQACADADILKVSHHGSKYASTAEMLDIVTPNTAIISVGNNSYGHPTQEALERLSATDADIYRTDVSGAILITIDESGYKVKQTIQNGELQ